MSPFVGPTSRPSVRRPVATAAVVAVALVAAGCSSDPGDPGASSGPPSATPGSSPGTGATTPPTSTATSATPDPTAGPRGPVPVSAAGLRRVVAKAFDDGEGARLDVDNGLGLLTATGIADFRADPTALGLTLTSIESGDAQPVVVKILGSRLFISSQERWLLVDIDGPRNPFGRSLTDQLDPRGVMGVVADHLTAASRRGTVEQAGEQLTVYRVTADGPAVAAELAPDLASRDAGATEAAGGVPAQVTATIAVDDAGHARKVTVDLGAVGEIDYTLTGWSDTSDLSVPEPPAPLTDDLTGLR